MRIHDVYRRSPNTFWMNVRIVCRVIHAAAEHLSQRTLARGTLDEGDSDEGTADVSITWLDGHSGCAVDVDRTHYWAQSLSECHLSLKSVLHAAKPAPIPLIQANTPCFSFSSSDDDCSTPKLAALALIQESTRIRAAEANAADVQRRTRPCAMGTRSVN